MRCDLAHSEDRKALYPFRAEVWKGPLTVEQFIAREESLYDHPFGKMKMETYVWRHDDGQAVSGLDALHIPFLVKEGASLKEIEGVLIASVVTPPVYRKKGYCTDLLRAFLQRRDTIPMVLYSEVSPEFYGRLGFALFPSTRLDFAVTGGSTLSAVPITQQKLVETLRGTRRLTLQNSASPQGIAVFPDLTFFDWRVERYRTTAALVGHSFPTQLYWQGSHNGELFFVAAAPDFAVGQVDCLWWSGDEKQVVHWLSELATRWGLKKACYWSDAQSPGKKELAMVRGTQGKTAGTLLAAQLCDWW